MRELWIMAYRQILRFLRARARLVGTFVNPIIWLVFFGLGWSRVFSFPAAKTVFGTDYLSFMTPGVVAMSIFTVSFFSGASVIWDREFGFLKTVLVAPAPRGLTLIGRVLGDSLISTFQGMIMLLIAKTVAHGIRISGVPGAALVGFLMAMSTTSIGVTLALKMQTIEGFQMVINFLTMPLIFLAGTFYPVRYLPSWLRAVSFVNPLTYAVDGLRGFLTGNFSFPLAFDLSMLAVLATLSLSIASAIFSKE